MQSHLETLSPPKNHPKACNSRLTNSTKTLELASLLLSLFSMLTLTNSLSIQTTNQKLIPNFCYYSVVISKNSLTQAPELLLPNAALR